MFRGRESGLGPLACHLIEAVAFASLLALAALGTLAGNAPILAGIVRVTIWSAFAMAVTASSGTVLGTKDKKQPELAKKAKWRG